MGNVDNKSVELDEHTINIKREILNRFNEYNRTVDYMLADAPIAVLCLPTNIDKPLRNYGCLRVYDLIGLDFSKVEGLDDTRIQRLTSCLNQFLSVG